VCAFGLTRGVSWFTLSRYAGVVDCIRQTVKTEGVWGLYKGVWPTWMRIGPFALVFFVSLEHFQNMFGVGPRS